MDDDGTETDEDLERELGWKVCATEECLGVRPSDSAHCLAHTPIDDRRQRLHAEAAAGRPLDFRGMVLDQTLLDAGLDVYREVYGVKRLPGLLLDGAVVQCHLLLPGYEIPQGIHARAAFFDSEIDLRDAQLGGLDWIAASLKRGAIFAGAEITETADFRRVKAYSLDLSQGHFQSLDLREFLCLTLFDMKSSNVSDALSAVDAQFHGVTMLEKPIWLTATLNARNSVQLLKCPIRNQTPNCPTSILVSTYSIWSLTAKPASRTLTSVPTSQ